MLSEPSNVQYLPVAQSSKRELQVCVESSDRGMRRARLKSSPMHVCVCVAKSVTAVDSGIVFGTEGIALRIPTRAERQVSFAYLRTYQGGRL